MCFWVAGLHSLVTAKDQQTTARQLPNNIKKLKKKNCPGLQVRCRYLLRVSVTGKGMTPDSKRDFNIWVTNYEQASEAAAPIKVRQGRQGFCRSLIDYRSWAVCTTMRQGRAGLLT